MKYNEKNQIVNTVPVSRGILEHLGRKLNPNEFTVLIYLILRADFKTGCCITSSGDLSTRIGLAQGTIRRILQTLSKEGYIKLFFESPNKTYPILVNRYHTEKGDVDAHGTESIQNIQYHQSYSNTEDTRRVTNNTLRIGENSALTETGRVTREIPDSNNPQVLPFNSNPISERSACNQSEHRLGNKGGDKQGDKSGDKQAPTESTESRYHGNKEGDKQGDRLGDKLGTLLKKNKEIRKEEEKENKKEREEGRFFETKNRALSKKKINKENDFFEYEGKKYSKSEYRIDDRNILINLKYDYENENYPVMIYDLPGRPRIKRSLIDTEKYFIHFGTAYERGWWYLDDEWLDMEPTVRARKGIDV